MLNYFILFYFCDKNKDLIQLFESIIDLAQQRYFEDPAFLNYLEYLQYWKKPEYAKYIMFHFISIKYIKNKLKLN